MNEDLIKIRQALEIISKDSIILKNFPYGCCGNASNLIATYLEDKGYGEFQYILGKNKEETKSHAWLLSVKNNCIVDLTGDQFGFEKIIWVLKEKYPLIEFFPKTKNLGNASIFSDKGGILYIILPIKSYWIIWTD